MDNELILRQFEEIEQKVEKVINARKSIEATNLELRNKIDKLEEELQGKVEVEKGYTEERDLIRSKVDSLLARIEELTEA